MLNAQQLDGLLQGNPPLRSGDARQAVLQVAPHGEVSKQVGILKHVAHSTLMRRDKEALGTVLPQLAVDLQVAFARLIQPGKTT